MASNPHVGLAFRFMEESESLSYSEVGSFKAVVLIPWDHALMTSPATKWCLFFPQFSQFFFGWLGGRGGGEYRRRYFPKYGEYRRIANQDGKYSFKNVGSLPVQVDASCSYSGKLPVKPFRQFNSLEVLRVIQCWNSSPYAWCRMDVFGCC